MKHLFTTLALLLGLSVWAMPQVQADDDAPVATKKSGKKKTEKKKPEVKLTPVAQALADAGYFTETEANPKAKVYIFICSASWCGPCRALMPQIVKEYEKKIKKNKSVSLVLLCADRTEEDAKKYIEHYETDMPGVMIKTVQLENMPNLDYIPSCVYMNAKGEVLFAGPGNKVLEWKKLMRNKPQKN